MAKVPHGVEILPKILIVWVGRTNVTDDRQTDRQTDGPSMTNSEHELEFTFAKKTSHLLLTFQYCSIPTHGAAIYDIALYQLQATSEYVLSITDA